MSFSQDVKREITTIETNFEGYKAELYGITKLKSSLVISNRKLNLEYVTSNISLARRIVFLLKKIFEVNVDILTKEQNKLDYKKLYYIIARDDVNKILESLDLLNEEMSFKYEVSNNYNNYKASVIRGMFLAKGSINDPAKSNYHLEIVCNEKEEVEFIKNTLKEFGVTTKSVERRKGIVVYIKKADQIGDFLKYIGATSLLFHFENERIKRDLNNVINRVMNCDMANSDRTQKSADRQLEAIDLIEKNLDVASLSLRLQDAIKLRKALPDSSLSEISEASYETIGRYISKSGLSHCFKDLETLAQTIKK
ncbi:MAG: DNA-binding protein WhiA [Bacilli bacterium]